MIPISVHFFTFFISCSFIFGVIFLLKDPIDKLFERNPRSQEKKQLMCSVVCVVYLLFYLLKMYGPLAETQVSYKYNELLGKFEAEGHILENNNRLSFVHDGTFDAVVSFFVPAVLIILC